MILLSNIQLKRAKLYYSRFKLLITQKHKSILFSTTADWTFVIGLVLNCVLWPDFLHLFVYLCDFLEVHLGLYLKVVLLYEFCWLCDARLHFILDYFPMLVKELFCLILSDVFFVFVLIMDHNHFGNIIGLEKVNFV